MTDIAQASSSRLGPIKLSPGIRPVNALALFFSGMVVIVFITFLNLLQPYILYEHLKIDTAVQGDFTGNVYIFTEIVSLILVVPLGIFSDHIGRRPVMTGGFVFFLIGLILIPLATTNEMYILFRVMASIGVACGVTMIASLLADYPDNSARGKMISINGVCTGLGVVFIASFGLAQLPEYFVSQGYAPTIAGRYTFWTAGALSVIAFIVAWSGLKGGRDEHQKHERKSMRESFKESIGEISNSPRLLLGCGATFVSRGDLTVLAAFFSLWIVAVGTEQGLGTSDVQGAAGRLFGISQISMILFTPLAGILVDRIDRVTALAIAMGVAAAGYLALGLVDNPLGSMWIYPVALLAGAGEACVIVSAPSLVGQEAPGRLRGSIFGFIAFAGAVGVLVNIKISGILFDVWMYQAPFILMAALNFVVCCWAIYVRINYGVRAANHR
jgi:MFS family permease